MRDSKNTVSIVLEGFIIYIPFNDLVDMEDEIVRLTEEQKKLQSEIDRAKLKLSNKEFINKAPKNIVDEERIKLQKYLDMYNKVVDRLSNLGV
jgi:valyl-tRNA synthetase